MKGINPLAQAELFKAEQGPKASFDAEGPQHPLTETPLKGSLPSQVKSALEPQTLLWAWLAELFTLSLVIQCGPRGAAG